MKKLLFLAVLAIFTINNAQNCIKQIVCADKTVTSQNVIDQLYELSDYMKTYCSTAVGSNKDTLDLKTNLNIDSSILTDILNINDKTTDINTVDKNELKEIFLVTDYLLINIFKLLENNIQAIKQNKILSINGYSGIQISNDSKFITTYNIGNKALEIIDAQTYKVLHSFPGDYRNIEISNDNNFIAAVNSGNKSLEIIDTKNYALLHSIKTSYGIVKISSDNTFIAAKNIDNETLDIIDTQNYKTLKSFPGNYTDIQISNDGKFIAASNYSTNKLDIIDTQNYKIVNSIPGNYSYIKISNDSNFIAARDSTYKKLYIFDTQNYKALYSIELLHSFLFDDYSDFQISNDSQFIAARNSTKNTLDIIDTQTYNVLKSFPGNYYYIEISSDGKFIVASNNSTNQLDIIDTQNYAILESVKGKYYFTKISRNNKFIVACHHMDHTLNFFQLITPNYQKISNFVVNNIDIIPDKEFKYFNLEFATEYKDIMGIEQYNALQKSISDELKRRKDEEQEIKQKQIDNSNQSDVEKIINRCLSQN